MELKTSLNEEMTKRFQAVKENTGVKSDKEVLAILISREYSRIERRKIRRVFLSNETYDLIEKTAEARGQTVDEYVEELTEGLIRKAKEGVTHGSSN